MSAHPNAMLLLILTPDRLARKTYRDIKKEFDLFSDDSPFEIGDEEYHHEVMEDDYNEPNQIKAKEGDIIIWDLVTYGYGEKIIWDKLETQKIDLENWAKEICKKYSCNYEVFISANYW